MEMYLLVEILAEILINAIKVKNKSSFESHPKAEVACVCVCV